jgi:putative ABC transport system substrate-binding protein
MESDICRDRRRAIVRAGAALGLIVAAALAGCGSDDTGSGGGEGTSATIGVIEQAEVPVFDEMVAGYRDGFAKAAGIPVSNVEISVKNAQGDPSLIQTIARDLARGSYDQYAAIGTPAVIALAEQDDTTPIVAVAMTDPVGAGVADRLTRPGRNVTGSSDAVAPAAIVSYLAAMKPRPARVGTILDPSNAASSFFLKGIKPLLEARGMTLVEAPISGPSEISSAARSLAGRVDAIALTGDALATGVGLPAITATAIARKVPLLVAAGIDPNTDGVLAVLSPDNHQLGVLAGRIGGRIFRGRAKPETTPFARIPPRVAVNRETERRLGITVPTSLD